MGAGPSIKQTFGDLVIHTPHVDHPDAACRGRSRPSTTRRSASCCSSSATPSSRRPRSTDGPAPPCTRTGATWTRRWSSTAWAGAGCSASSGYQPPDAPLSRGLEVHPGGAADELEIWIDRGYVPAGYSWSFPAARRGPGRASAPSTPASTSRSRPSGWREDLDRDAVRYQGNWIPHQLRERPRTTSSSSATRPGTACRSPPRESAPPSTSGSPAGASCGASSTGRATREDGAARYARLLGRARWHFECCCGSSGSSPGCRRGCWRRRCAG